MSVRASACHGQADLLKGGCSNAKTSDKRFRVKSAPWPDDHLQTDPTVLCPKATPSHRHPRSERHALIKVEHVAIVQSNAALGCGRANGPGRVGSVNAIHAGP